MLSLKHYNRASGFLKANVSDTAGLTVPSGVGASAVAHILHTRIVFMAAIVLDGKRLRRRDRRSSGSDVKQTLRIEPWRRVRGKPPRKGRFPLAVTRVLRPRR